MEQPQGCIRFYVTFFLTKLMKYNQVYISVHIVKYFVLDIGVSLCFCEGMQILKISSSQSDVEPRIKTLSSSSLLKVKSPY